MDEIDKIVAEVYPPPARGYPYLATIMTLDGEVFVAERAVSNGAGWDRIRELLTEAHNQLTAEKDRCAAKKSNLH